MDVYIRMNNRLFYENPIPLLSISFADHHLSLQLRQSTDGVHTGFVIQGLPSSEFCNLHGRRFDRSDLPKCNICTEP